MASESNGRLWAHFGYMPDPWIERTKLHELVDIIGIAICAVICVTDEWVNFAV